MARRTKHQTLHAIWQHLKLFFVLIMGYLLQMCVMPYLALSGITPSLIMVVIAIVTVGFGRQRAFWAGAVYGILLETMLPTTKMLNLVLYPATAMLGGVIFSDKTTQQLEFERSLGKAGRDLSPLLRTPLCAFFNILVYEVVNIAYIYLRGSELQAINFTRGIMDIVLTTALCLVLMMPVRRFLGFRLVRPEEKAPTRYMPAQ